VCVCVCVLHLVKRQLKSFRFRKLIHRKPVKHPRENAGLEVKVLSAILYNTKYLVCIWYLVRFAPGKYVGSKNGVIVMELYVPPIVSSGGGTHVHTHTHTHSHTHTCTHTYAKVPIHV